VAKENEVKMDLLQENRKTEDKAKKWPQLVLIVILILIAIGSIYAKKYYDERKEANMAATAVRPLPTVTVVPAVETDLFAQKEYIGKVDAIQSVEVRAQVVGEIMKVNFKEGSIVKVGQPLYTLDARKYEATVTLRKGQLAQAKADLDRAEKFFARLKNADERSVSKADFDSAESAVMQALAAVEQANANLRLAMIDLGNTVIRSPISGRIGATNFTKGNYISATSGALATIVQMDPIRVKFSMPDKDYLNQLAIFKENGSVYNTTLKLSNGDVITASGERDFEDNQMDQKTGSMSMRIRFNNPEGLLIPGSMVRIATKQVKSQLVIVVPQTALLADSASDYVYVVDSDNVIKKVEITLGTEVGSMREVTSGIKAGDRVVTTGIQNIRPGIKVNIAEPAEKTTASLASQSEADNNIVSDANGKDSVLSDDKSEPVKKEGN